MLSFVYNLSCYTMANSEHTSSSADEFYIGYLPNAPAGHARLTRLFVIVIALAIPLIAGALVLSQRGFSTGTYELGNQTVVEGIASLKPVPSLKIIQGYDAVGKPVFQTLVLMSFGKFGAANHLLDFEEQAGKPLNELVLKLTGTLDYRDGKALFELTNRNKSLISISEDLSPFKGADLSPAVSELGPVTILGEIVDPKCFSGTMKPGEGKPHRSCAIRCISGGIPPVLVSTNEAGQRSYFLLLGSKGEPINQQILDRIADPVEVKGELFRYDDWYVIQAASDEITRIP